MYILFIYRKRSKELMIGKRKSQRSFSIENISSYKDYDFLFKTKPKRQASARYDYFPLKIKYPIDLDEIKKEMNNIMLLMDVI
jgi:hypothetical protein